MEDAEFDAKPIVLHGGCGVRCEANALPELKLPCIYHPLPLHSALLGGRSSFFNELQRATGQPNRVSQHQQCNNEQSVNIKNSYLNTSGGKKCKGEKSPMKIERYLPEPMRDEIKVIALNEIKCLERAFLSFLNESSN